MERSVKDLSKYRFEKAEKNIKLARVLFHDKQFSFALNRAYYAAFDAMRAVNALDGFDSSKHSGVISYFNQNHVKSGDFDVSVSKVIRRASRLRERSDYEDFYEPDKEETAVTIKEVSELLEMIRVFLGSKGIL